MALSFTIKAMGRFTHHIRRKLGIWLLVTFFIKTVAPAISHAAEAAPSQRDAWRVAVCTSTGLKYITVAPAVETSDSSDTSYPEHRAQSDHCLLCATGSKDTCTGDHASDLLGKPQGLLRVSTVCSESASHARPWPASHPRAPPVTI